MKSLHLLGVNMIVLAATAGVLLADVTATIERLEAGQNARRGDDSTTQPTFEKIPVPVKDDLAKDATFAIVDGIAEGALATLHDGKLPAEADEPSANFYFAGGTIGGRLRVDLGSVKEIGQINTYSRHTGERTPQIYTVYAADGTETNFNTDPKLYLDPAHAGWTKLADIDTRQSRRGAQGGMVGVSLVDNDYGTIGSYRYLLFDIKRTDDDSPYANTFFSELDVVAPDKIARLKPTVTVDPNAPRYRIIIETDGLSPRMQAWAKESLEPVCKEWYPKIADMLPSDGFRAPKTFRVVFREDMGGTPAAAAGTRVMCNLQWFEKQVEANGEGAGAVVHEMVHVVQQYRFGSKRTPFWLQEGIPDYIRWYLYEPEKNGAAIRDIDKAKYDQAYRVSANFLNWATNTYDKELVRKLNAAIRAGTYTDAMWHDLTGGKTLDQLDAEWKAWLKENPS